MKVDFFCQTNNISQIRDKLASVQFDENQGADAALYDNLFALKSLLLVMTVLNEIWSTACDKDKNKLANNLSQKRKNLRTQHRRDSPQHKRIRLERETTQPFINMPATLIGIFFIW